MGRNMQLRPPGPRADPGGSESPDQRRQGAEGRSVGGDGDRQSARRRDLTLALQHLPGRVRPGDEGARDPDRALRGRHPDLCPKRETGGALPGDRHEGPGRGPETGGEPGEDPHHQCPTRGGVPGVHDLPDVRLHPPEAGETLQGPGAPDDPPKRWGICGANGPEPQPVPAGMDQLLPPGQLQGAGGGYDGLDPPTPPYEADAGVEGLEGSPPGTAPAWVSGRVPENLHATLAELGEPSREHGAPEPVVR